MWRFWRFFWRVDRISLFPSSGFFLWLVFSCCQLFCTCFTNIWWFWVRSLSALGTDSARFTIIESSLGFLAKLFNSPWLVLIFILFIIGCWNDQFEQGNWHWRLWVSSLMPLTLFTFLSFVWSIIEEKSWCLRLFCHCISNRQILVHGWCRLKLESLINSLFEIMELTHRLEVWQSFCSLLLGIQNFVES